jgi:hypothetical protein
LDGFAPALAFSNPMKNSTVRTNQLNYKLSRLDKVVTVSADTKCALNVTMLYEDDQTREWAREAYNRVLKLAGEQPVRPTWWRLSNLDQPGVLAAASSTAMRADVIVVAVRAAEGLPLAFYAWTNFWSANRQQLNGVLVAMLGTPQIKNQRSGRVGDFLRTVAKQARLHLLIEQRNCSAAPAEQVNGSSQNGHPSPLAVRF